MDLVLDIAWLPASDTRLAVTMPLAVVVFDLALSARTPSLAVVLPSADFIASSAMGLHLVTHPEVRTVWKCLRRMCDAAKVLICILLVWSLPTASMQCKLPGLTGI